MTPDEIRATQTRFATLAARPAEDKCFKMNLRMPIYVGKTDGVISLDQPSEGHAQLCKNKFLAFGLKEKLKRGGTTSEKDIFRRLVWDRTLRITLLEAPIGLHGCRGIDPLYCPIHADCTPC